MLGCPGKPKQGGQCQGYLMNGRDHCPYYNWQIKYQHGIIMKEFHKCIESVRTHGAGDPEG
jgi:hypothetical protein